MTTEERLRSLLEAATPGPWRVVEDDEGTYVWADTAPHGIDPTTWDGCVALVSGPGYEDHDSPLIVEAVNALPKLLAVVAAARKLYNEASVDGLRIPYATLDAMEAALAALDEEGKR